MIHNIEYRKEIIMTNFKIVIIFGLILFSISAKLNGQDQVTDNLQDAKRLNPTSPQSSDFIKYGNTPVNLFTGETNVQIPIYTYKDRDFTIPIYLGYNSSGFIPNKREGIVGLNWYLNAGGVITRKVNGWPDDKKGAPANDPPKLHGLYYGIKDNNKTVKLTSRSSIFNFQVGLVLPSEYWTIDSCEVEPDEFTVTAPGLHGSFFIENSGNVHFVGNKSYKVDLTNFRIQPPNNTTIYNSEIVITSDHGYKYYFGDSIQYLEISYPFDDSTTPNTTSGPTIVGWHLTKIEAPNGRTVHYIYKHFNEGIADKFAEDQVHYLMNVHDADFTSYQSDCTSFGGGLCSYNSNSNGGPIYEVTKTVYLEKILVDQDTIKFSYGQRANKFYDITSNYNQRTLELDHIYIKHGSDSIKSFTFDYDYTGGTYSRYFLSSFQEDGIPPYLFTYYKQTGLPSPRTHGVDYWGFWNGKASDGPIIPSLSYSQDGEIIYTGDEREPDESKCDVGLLEQIDYPTGGYTQFSYEGHRYSQRLERRIDNNFLPALYFENNLLAGGARIKEIRDDDRKGNEVIKTYEYTNDYPSGGESSGILLDWPKYIYAWRYSNPDEGLDQVNVKKQSQSFNQNHNSGEKYIQYSEVTEREYPSNGYTVYKYTSFETNPDINDYGSIETDSNWLSYVNNVNLYNNYVGIRMNDCSFQRGFPYDVTTYSNSGEKVSEKETSYTQVPDYPDNYAVGVMQTGGLAVSYKMYYIPFLPLGETLISYSNTGNVTKTIDFAYNVDNLVREKEVAADGSLYNTKYKYTKDYYLGAATYSSSASIFRTMVERNILTSPVEITQMKDGNVTASKLNLYKLENNIIVPDESYELELMAPISYPPTGLSYTAFDGTNMVVFNKSSDYKLREQYVRHDNFGNIIEYQKKDDLPMAYLWDSYGTQLIAAVMNAHYLPYSTQTNVLSFSSPYGEPGGTLFDGNDVSNIKVGSTATISVESCFIPPNPDDPKSVEFYLVNNGTLFQETLSANQSVNIPMTADDFSYLDLVKNDNNIIVTGTFSYVSEAPSDEVSEVYYQGFEEYPSSTLCSTAKTGKYIWEGTFNIPLNMVKPSSYQLSYWISTDKVNWQQISQIVTVSSGSSAYSIGGSGTYIDEVRLYPESNSQMTTYTYNPLVGMTSETDPNGQTTYYEYDDFGRLKRIRNNDRAIVSQYDYHYYSETTLPDSPYLNTSTTSMSFSSSGGSSTFTISSNCSWTISDNVSWLTVAPASGNDDGTITVIAEANSSGARAATITIAYAENLTQTINVTQSEGVPGTLTVSPTSLAFVMEGGTKTCTVTSNTFWSVTDNSDWISLSPVEGMGDGSFVVTCSLNPGGTLAEPRGATITISTGDIIHTVYVSQDGFQHP